MLSPHPAARKMDIAQRAKLAEQTHPAAAGQPAHPIRLDLFHESGKHCERSKRTIGYPLEPHQFFSLGQAARETGTSKATIFKALKSGKLSYVEKTPAGYKIDPAELFRVFPPITPVNGQSEQTRTSGNDLETAFLRRENELLREQLERERQQADHWRQQATMLLTHQPEPKAQPTAAPFWRRLFGG